MDHRGQSDLVLEILDELFREIERIWAPTHAAVNVRDRALDVIQAKMDQFEPKT